MARKSIFDIASNSLKICNEANRIVQMFYEENTLYLHSRGCTIVEYIDAYVFEDWKWRGHFIDVDDFMEGIEYENIVQRCKENDIDSFITLIELVYNFWELSYRDIHSDNSELKWSGNFHHLVEVMDDNLQKYNFKAYNCDDRVLVVEDKPEVTAVAEIVEQKLALDIIRYNHRSLQGEIEAKKAILLSLAAELEPRRKELQTLNKQLSEDIFFMLNNINIRHNNRNKNDKNYKEFVAKMRKDRLEKWYDELYQMMLLAILLLDNVDRSIKVKELKSKITEG